MGIKQLIIFVINAFLDVLSLLILLRAVLSFFARAGGTVYKIYCAVVTVTDPVLRPIQQLLNMIPALSNLPVDFSPIAALILISLVRTLVNAV